MSGKTINYIPLPLFMRICAIASIYGNKLWLVLVSHFIARRSNGRSLGQDGIYCIDSRVSELGSHCSY